MATLTSKIYENITLNGNDLGAYTSYNIDNIKNKDNQKKKQCGNMSIEYNHATINCVPSSK